MATGESTEQSTDAPIEENTEKPIEDVTEEPTEFSITEFNNSVVSLSKQYTSDDVSAATDILSENIGKDKLEELIAKYGEVPTQNAIAEILSFAPEIKKNQYIQSNGLEYNPNAEEDYDSKLCDADEAYRVANGKNPDGALMSLDGYDTHKSNREAMKDLIAKSGDTYLLTWYIAKTDGYDLMMSQVRDTQKAEEYKNQILLELVNSAGTIKLLELQLEQEAEGNLDVVDEATNRYTDAYNSFILSNYMYVVAE